MIIINEKDIDSTVSELTVVLNRDDNDFSFLKKYPNVKELIIGDYGNLTSEQIINIKNNSNVELVRTEYPIYLLDRFVNEEGFTVLEWPYSYINYKGMNVIPNVEPPIESALSFPKTEIFAYSLDDLNLEVAELFYNQSDDRLKKELRLRFSDGDSYEIIFDDNKVINNIEANTDSFVDVKKVISYFIQRGYSVNEVMIKLKNSNYYYIDSSILDNIPSKINIDYGELREASLEEFKGMQAAINYYRKLILDANLSPLERLMFAYDILKTFEYKENNDNKDESRYAHLIISTGNIVCVGYSYLLKEILSNLDENIFVSSFSCTCRDKDDNFLGGHQRSLVRVNDDKYNVHGIYALDATWDSDKSKRIKSDKYTSLDLYRYFLVPRGLYKSVFPYDSIPDIFKFDTGVKFYEGFVGDNCKDLFPDKIVDKNKFVYSYKEIISDVELRTWLDVQRPSLDMFNEMLLNVRMAEGFTKEEALKEVEKVYLLNKRVIELSADSEGEIPFFENNIVKK